MKTSLVLAASLAILPTAFAQASDEPKPGMAQGRTILLVDDHDVLYRAGTKRVIHPAQRHSDKALIVADKPWEMLIGYTSVYRNPKTGKYQLWYQAYSGGRSGDKKLKCVIAYAESDDGVAFTKPEFDLFPFLGEPSNIVLDSNGGFGDRYGASVIVDPQEKDPAKRYKSLYYDWSEVNGREEAGLHAAFSPDGIQWTKHPGTLLNTSYGRYREPPFSDEEPYIDIPATATKPKLKRIFYPLTMSDVIDVFWDPPHQEYVVNSKMWIDGPAGTGAWKNAVGQTRSKDFIHWSEAKLLFAPDDQDNPFHGFHGAPTFYHKGRYLSQVHVMDRRYDLQDDIELMVSVDGQRWERPFRDEYFLARSKPGAFDSLSIWSSTPPVVLDDEIRFYYGGYNTARTGADKAPQSEKSGVGLATIPLDRFGGVRPLAESKQPTLGSRPVENIGQVTFKPLDLKGVKQITINANATKGAVQVELLNEQGYRVRGYAKLDATPLEGDSLRHQVSWKEHQLKDLPPGKYSLRVHLDNATLYAVDFK